MSSTHEQDLDYDEIELLKREECIVRMLLKRYRLPKSCKFELWAACESLEGEKRLSLDLFRDRFRSYPVYLHTGVYRHLQKGCLVKHLFMEFQTLPFVQDFDGYNNSLPKWARKKYCGLVFKWPYLGRGSGESKFVALHNHPINPEGPMADGASFGHHLQMKLDGHVHQRYAECGREKVELSTENGVVQKACRVNAARQACADA